MSDTSSRVQKAYDEWAEIYDTNENATRDLNYQAIRRESFSFAGKTVLEIGCGTGLNTQHIARKAKKVIGVDFSEQMLSKAKKRNVGENIRFVRADITKAWDFETGSVDFIVANLVLEHVKVLSYIFNEAYRVLRRNGKIYLAELHPYKQIQRSQAKYISRKTGEEIRVDAFIHSTSEYVNEGLSSGFSLVQMQEWQKEDEHIPRLLSLLFEKKAGTS